MKRLFVILLLVCPLQAQIIVQAGKQQQLVVPNATSAVSLDTNIADIIFADGTMTIKGVSIGATRIVTMKWDGMQEYWVQVTAGPSVYPPGFVAPENISNDNGSVEFRFSSDQMRLDNIVDFDSTDLGINKQTHLAVSTPFAYGETRTYVPSAYYRITTEKRDVILFDDAVQNSELTLQDAPLRGLHWKQGPWQFHGGYTTSADFADVLVPTQKEFVSGVSYAKRLNFFTATPNLYFLHSIDLATGQLRSGFISSMQLNFFMPPNWKLQGEIAYGRGMAYATELDHAGDSTSFKAKLAYKKLDFPTVEANSLPGLDGELSYTKSFTPRLSFISGGTVNNIKLTTIEQDTDNAFGNVRYKFSDSWSFGTGVNFGAFHDPGVYSEKTLSLPQQLSFDRKHFGAGVQYLFSTASDSFSNGDGLTQSARLALGRFQIGEYASYQNDALSVDSLLSQIPGLQQALQELGISAATPQQLASLLQSSAFLESLGLSGQAKIVTIPRRVQKGASLSWNSTGLRPHRLNVSFIENHNEFTLNSYNDYNLTGSYAKDIGNNSRVQLSWSLLRTSLAGHEELMPLVSASFRHTFSAVPSVFSARNKGSISGTIYVDASHSGIYENGMDTIAGTTVVLDGHRTVTSDASGHFAFDNVPAGNHHLQAKYDSARPHYFTTPNDSVVATGSTVNFGVTFPTFDLWGYVEDDAGNGMENVALQIQGPGGPVNVTTDHRGKFSVPNVAIGDYKIQVNVQTVALGYAAEQLAPIAASVSETSSSHPVIKIPANRALMGTVTSYDAGLGNYVAVKDAVVTIPQLHRNATTNASGKFVIAQLPEGNFAVTVNAGNSSLTQTVSLPVHPVTLHDDFRISSLNGQITYTLASAAY